MFNGGLEYLQRGVTTARDEMLTLL